jgi:WD40 repeat protein
MSWLQVRRVLHEELALLPERYRAPLVVCFLEGFTQEAAARHLRIAKSTLRVRLDRGRELLRPRLIRRGLGSAAFLASTALCPPTTFAGLPGSLLIGTAQAASTIAAGNSAVAATSASVARLLKEALNSLFMAKVKAFAAALLVGLGALALGASMAPLPAYESSAKQSPVRKATTKREQVRAPAWKISKTLPDHDGQLTRVAFSRDGKRLASAGGDGSVMVWDADNQSLRHTLYCSDQVMALAFAPDGKSLVTASGMTNNDYAIVFWDPETGKKQATINEHAYPIHCLSFSQDGKILVSTVCPIDMTKAREDDGEVSFWNAETRVKITTLKRPLAYEAVLCQGGHKLLVVSAGRVAVLSKIDDKFVTGESEAAFARDQICCTALTPDGKTLALAPTSGWSSIVTLCNLVTNTPLSSFLHKTGSVRCLAFAPDGRTLVTGAWTTTNKGDESKTKKVGVEAELAGEIKFWDVATGKEKQTLSQKGPVVSLAFSPDGRTLAVGLLHNGKLRTKKEDGFDIPPASQHGAVVLCELK